MNNPKTLSLKHVIGIAALIAGCPTGVLAQSDDFGYDLSIEGETKLASGLKLELEAGMRTQNDATKIDRYTLGAGLSYKLYQTSDKKFDIKADARFEYLWTQKLQEKDIKYFVEDDDLVKDEFFKVGDEKGYNITDRYWRDRYRINVGFSAGYTLNKRWSFSLKETIQQNHYCDATATQTKWRVDEYNSKVDEEGNINWIISDWEYNDNYIDENHFDENGNVIGKSKNTEEDTKRHKDRTVLRSKLSASYDVKGFPVDVFASVDYGCGINYTANKWKFTVGYDYKINKENKLSLFYRYNTENDDDEANGHLIGLSYKIDF